MLLESYNYFSLQWTLPVIGKYWYILVTIWKVLYFLPFSSLDIIVEE